ncbi:MAG: sulfatase, partial [Bacteroidota bacterium]
LDRLASQSVRFERAFAPYGVCAPARHAIITGQYPPTNGAGAMRTWKRTSAIKDITDPELLAIPVYEATPPNPDVRCFPQFLRAAGYYCTNNAKEDYQFRSFPSIWDESSRRAHYSNRMPSQPFFAVFNQEVTHESRVHKTTSPRVTDPATVPLPPYYPDTDTVRRDVARHYDNIVALDAWVGQMLAELEASGEADNTIVFFYGDHGDGLPRHKRWVYDSGTRVPLLVRWPDGQGAGMVDTQLVSFVDFAPSLLALAGLPLPDYLEGQDFLSENRPPARTHVFAFRDRMDPAPETIRAVRDHRYQYVRNYRPELPYLGYLPYRDRVAMMADIHRGIEDGTLGAEQWQFWAKTKPLEELYDTETDPHQVRNLAADPAHFTKLAELRKALADFQARHTDLNLLPDAEVVARLWGADGKQPVTEVPELGPVLNLHGRIATFLMKPGTSIIWRPVGETRWRLFGAGGIHEKYGSFEAQAWRIGWQASAVVTFER